MASVQKKGGAASLRAESTRRVGTTMSRVVPRHGTVETKLAEIVPKDRDQPREHLFTEEGQRPHPFVPKALGPGPAVFLSPWNRLHQPLEVIVGLSDVMQDRSQAQKVMKTPPPALHIKSHGTKLFPSGEAPEGFRRPQGFPKVPRKQGLVGQFRATLSGRKGLRQKALRRRAHPLLSLTGEKMPHPMRRRPPKPRSWRQSEDSSESPLISTANPTTFRSLIRRVLRT